MSTPLRYRALNLEPYIRPLYAQTAAAPVFGLDGEPTGQVELPDHFMEPIRVDLIRRAYLSALTASLQPKGTDPAAGKRHSVLGGAHGVGLGIARVPRYKGHLWPRAAIVPNAVGGRRAHPPKVEKVLHERINKRERRLAIRSAIAATGVRELVAARGHVVGPVKHVPLVLASDVESIDRAAQLRRVLKAVGAWEDVERAQRRTRVRAGKGKMRGRRYKTPKSLLIVVGGYVPVIRAGRNFPGVDVVNVRDLSVMYLAPGGAPGRLTLWTVNALEALRGLFRP